MPKSTAEEMTALREEVFARDGGCMWPGCNRLDLGPATADFVNPLQMAHLTHRGMGGSRERNTADNCITLCRQDHDVLDGRTPLQLAICRIRLAYVASLPVRHSHLRSLACIRRATVIGSGDGALALVPMSKSSSIGSMATESQRPSTSTIETTSDQTTDRTTSSRSATLTTPNITTSPRSTTKQPGSDTKKESAPHKSAESLVSIPPLSANDGVQWVWYSEELLISSRLAAMLESIKSGYENCTWPGCEQRASPPSLKQRADTYLEYSESLVCPPIAPGDLLCEVHEEICLDGRTGLGILRAELNSLFRALLGSSRSTP